jgi:hypothetical protein
VGNLDKAPWVVRMAHALLKLVMSIIQEAKGKNETCPPDQNEIISFLLILLSYLLLPLPFPKMGVA